MSAQRHENRLREHWSEGEGGMSSMLDQYCQMGSEAIRENPMMATMAAFGLGLGLGAMVGSMLAETGSMSRKRTAETIGQRVLESLADALPDPVRRRIHS